MLLSIIIILFCINNIRRARSDIVNNPVLSDAIIGLSLTGIVTSVLSMLGDIVNFIGLVSVDTLISLITYLVVNCNIIVSIITGFILLDQDYNLRAIIKMKFNELRAKNTRSKKLQ